MQAKYDYIITGAGCAGLSLLMRMIISGKFSEKKILLVDQSAKKLNDRTWCFWEKKEGFFENLVYSRWNKLWFISDKHTLLNDIVPYEYKMIRGIDFYEYCFSIINEQKNIEFVQATVEEINSYGSETFAIIDKKKINSDYIFNSIIFQEPSVSKKQFMLLQHFKGYIIETVRDCFNPHEAILMDFRTRQQYGTCFFYVMPFSKKRALVEYTVFSEKLLTEEDYNTALQDYLLNCLNISAYSLRHEEFGIIPMTNHDFDNKKGNILNIGTSGGNTKASSGYTFQFIQKNTAVITNAMVKNGVPCVKTQKKKFEFYDGVFLNTLVTKKISGKEIFECMFNKNRVTDIFCFLDNESSIIQDIRVINSLPKFPFLKAAIQQLF
ncbi:MAG TPA: lycopene cyclase family protein [Puia sp.]|nr:lycopene cyclase family protein [Puia sp.]